VSLDVNPLLIHLIEASLRPTAVVLVNAVVVVFVVFVVFVVLVVVAVFDEVLLTQEKMVFSMVVCFQF